MTSAVVFGYHDVGVRCLKVLLEAGVTVPLVFTHSDDPNENIWFGSVERLARDRGIDTLLNDEPSGSDCLERVAALRPDFIFSFYYRRMLSPGLLAQAKRGAYNMHGSLLPKYRGRAPVNWAVLHGELQTGATLHEMVEKPDAGRIAGQHAVPIGPDDTAAEVFNRVTDAAEIVLRRALPKLIDGSIELKVQDLKSGAYYGGRKPEDGHIDWSKPAAEIHNLVRAVAPPYPPAFTFIDGVRLEIHRTRRMEPDTRANNNVGLAATPTMYSAPDTANVHVRCAGGGTLVILEGCIANAPFTVLEFLSRFGPEPVSLLKQ